MLILTEYKEDEAKYRHRFSLFSKLLSLEYTMQIFLKEELDSLRAQKEEKDASPSYNQDQMPTISNPTPDESTTTTTTSSQDGNKIEEIFKKK
ncbi:hypothetical protein B9Z55_023576 [Caenorhabditis nigoni]|uniref:Uncharacterized protein n=1 Tax=Caenorhabditis nigoni TaxID=1611254 RepID=A0A2G5SR09_9PELO|nr:hypothetical protein B9Z55_023576 [Caenorhabditis nigoni]